MPVCFPLEMLTSAYQIQASRFQLPFRLLKCFPRTVRWRPVLEGDPHAEPSGTAVTSDSCSVTFLLLRYLQLFSLFNILSSEAPELSISCLTETWEVPTPRSHKWQMIDLQHLAPRRLISFTNERGCQRPQIIAVSMFQKRYPTSVAKLGIDSSSLVSGFLFLQFFFPFITQTLHEIEMFVGPSYYISLVLWCSTIQKQETMHTNFICCTWKDDWTGTYLVVKEVYRAISFYVLKLH